MTQLEWENAFEEERNAEFERCMDKVYFYNTYFKKPSDPVLTATDFEYIEQLFENSRKLRNQVNIKNVSTNKYPFTLTDCITEK